MFADRNPPEETICDTCNDERKRVELMPENEQAAKLFLLVRSQCECRWNGEQDIEIDLNHLALWKAIENFPGGIKDGWGTFNLIVRAWHESQRKKRDNDG